MGGRKTEIALMAALGILGFLFLTMVVPPLQGAGRVLFTKSWGGYNECIAKAFRSMTGNLEGCGERGSSPCSDTQICVSATAPVPCGKNEEHCACVPGDNCFATGCSDGEICSKQPPVCTTPGCLAQNSCESPTGFCVCEPAGFPVCAGEAVPDGTVEACEGLARDRCAALVVNAAQDLAESEPDTIAAVRTCAGLCGACKATACWDAESSVRDMCEALAAHCGNAEEPGSASPSGGTFALPAFATVCAAFPLRDPPVEYEGDDKDDYPDIYA